jgi:hypothetical protein
MYSRILMAILCALTLTACAMPTYSWYRPNLTEAEWRRDSYDCERDARMSALSFGTSIVGQVQAERFAQRCMESKGYERVAQ